MQLLEPTDSLFRVGRLFALLHQPLLQLPFGHTGRRDDPHGPRPGRSLPGRGQQCLIVLLRQLHPTVETEVREQIGLRLEDGLVVEDELHTPGLRQLLD